MCTPSPTHASLLAKQRFGQLTKWLDRLTPYDLSEVDAAGCTSIDAWLERLRGTTPLDVATTLTLDAGSNLADGCAFIGNLAGSQGTVTVGIAGSPACWVNSGGVGVGVDGTGTLKVANGGSVISHDDLDCLGLNVGVNPGGFGMVSMNTGSRFTTDTVVVGNGGTGVLTVDGESSLNQFNHLDRG